MKFAARFPIKNSPWLILSVFILHLALLLLTWAQINSLFHCGIITVTIVISYFYSRKQCHQLTNAPDDLCWNNEGWWMQLASKNTLYTENSLISENTLTRENNKDKTNIQQFDSTELTLLPSSWITSVACVLHFKDDLQKHYWLFSRDQLGSRSYGELVYLAQASLKLARSNQALK